MSAAASATLRPRPPTGMGRGLALALLVHALLVAAIAFSVRWRSSPPAGVEAELWAAVPQIAAPRGAPPEPEPVKPPPKPEPPKPLPKPPEPVAEKQPDAQIAIEKARREEAKREEAKREEQKRAKLQKEAEEQDKAEAQRAKKDAQDKAKKEQERVEKLREEQMQRLLGQAGATGEPKSTGTAARTAGPTAEYAGRIKAYLKPKIIFPDSVDGNPEAVVQVRVAPDGTILAKKLMKSSGIRAYDDAVLRAIEKAEQLPRPHEGTVPPVMDLSFRPNE